MMVGQSDLNKGSHANKGRPRGTIRVGSNRSKAFIVCKLSDKACCLGRARTPAKCHLLARPVMLGVGTDFPTSEGICMGKSKGARGKLGGLRASTRVGRFVGKG